MAVLPILPAVRGSARRMIRLACSCLLGILAIAAGAPAAGSSPLGIERLRCEYLANPTVIENPTPELSWIVTSGERGAKQTAYRVLAASSAEKLAANEGDLWDSGRVESSATFGVHYAGNPLASRQPCFWKVQVWNAKGEPSEWSKSAHWVAGLLKTSDWRGEWIGGATKKVENPPAELDGANWIWTAENDLDSGERVFYTTWDLPADLKMRSAWLTVVGGDITSFYLNGHEVTQTMHRFQPQMEDVRSQLKSGANRVSMMVRDGADGPRGACVKLVVTPEQGEPLVFTTNGKWRTTREQKATDADLGSNANDPEVWVAGKHGDEPWGVQRMANLATEPPHYLRHEFKLRGEVKRAVLSVATLGWADLFLNGQPITTERFGSGWTEYKKRVYYRSYDVTDHLQAGANAWGAILADGWYSGHIGWRGIRAHWGKFPRLKAQIDVEYADGSTETIATDSKWRRSLGPTTVADILMGEEYDARRDLGDWSSTGYDAKAWQPVATGAEHAPAVEPHPAPAVIVVKEWAPKSISEPKPGHYVFDFGQNFAGVCRLKVRGKAGQTIQLRFAERLNDDGTMYTTNLRTARVIDRYTCRGDGEEIWEPRLTFHGFQYVEATGLSEPPTKDLLTAVAISGDTAWAGDFDSSDEKLNQLASNIRWTQKANFIDLPTDCPQRDERLGWTGDAQIYMNAACLNADVQSFFRKWMIDVVDAQRADGQFPMVAPLCVAEDDGGPAYADAGVICPWTIYQFYGDKTHLAKQYPSMRKFIAFCRGRSLPGGIAPEKFHCFGDWLNVDAETPRDLIYTAYFGLSTQLTAQAARELGFTSDAEEYDRLFAEIQQGFTKKYFNAEGRTECDTQSSYVLALAYNLVPQELRPLVAERLIEGINKRNGKLSTGFIGTRDIMVTLASIGRNDIAYHLLQQPEYPGWMYSIGLGATSIWEHWDGWTPDKGFEDAHMNSFAHYSFGAVYGWMVENIGGIQRGAPAYGKIIIAPQPGGTLTSARTKYDSIRGPVETDWRLADGAMTLNFETPANTTTLVRLPTTEAGAVRADGQPLASLNVTPRTTDHGVEFELPSGRYNFVFPVKTVGTYIPKP